MLLSAGDRAVAGGALASDRPRGASAAGSARQSKHKAQACSPDKHKQALWRAQSGQHHLSEASFQVQEVAVRWWPSDAEGCCSVMCSTGMMQAVDQAEPLT